MTKGSALSAAKSSRSVTPQTRRRSRSVSMCMSTDLRLHMVPVPRLPPGVLGSPPARPPQGTEECAEILSEQHRLLEGGEMSAPGHFRPLLDVEEPFRPLSRRGKDISREAGEPGRHGRRPDPLLEQLDDPGHRPG